MRWGAGIAVLVAVAATAGQAAAYYVAQLQGTAQVRATTLPQGPLPSVQLVGRTATVTWPAATWPDGSAVPGYSVTRSADGPSTPVAAGGGCAGTLVGPSCSEAGLATGTWRYTVTTRAGIAWSGAPGPASAALTVPAPAFALARSAIGAPLPQAVVGSLSAFDVGEAITWRLDDPASGTVLGGTPAAGPDGTAAVSVTIPAGTSEGAHTVYAVGSGGARAGADLQVDLTPPVTTDSSAAIGSAWRPSATVVLSATDASSGVAATYWTTDGTTPTATSASGTSVPLTADGVYTVRYRSADRVGNLEAVRAAGTSIRIDATAPTVAAPATGGTVIGAGARLTTTAADPTVNGASSAVAAVVYFACPGSCTPTPGAAGTIAIGTSSTAPSYAVTWSSPPADGTYTLLARATDAAGNAASSPTIQRTVDTSPPQISTTVTDATVLEAGYVNNNAGFYAYANVVDAGAGPDPASVRADLSGQCGTGCGATVLSSSGGPFAVLTAAGWVSYAYRSALLQASGSPASAYTATAADLAGTKASATGAVTVDNSGKPGAPSAVTLVNGVTATAYATCATTANGYLNAVRAAMATVQVQTAQNAPANGVVSLTATDGTTTVSALSVVAAAGAQTATFSGLDLSRLADGTITLSAFEYSPGGKFASTTTTQSVTKLTATPTVAIANLVYADSTAPTADAVASTLAVGPVNGFLQFTQIAGTRVGTAYASTALASGRLASLALASETASPTYAVRAVDAACNPSATATWTPTDTR